MKQITLFIRNHKMNLMPIGISILLLLYFALFLIPYAGTHGFLNENLIPDNNEKLVYGLLSIPVVILYIIYIIIFTRKVTFLRSITYPLIIANVYFGIFLCLIREGGAILWLMVLTIIIPIALVLLCLVSGMIWDVRYYKRNKIEK